jgi:hypothetical protein
MTYPRISRASGFTPRELDLLLAVRVAKSHGVDPLQIFAQNRRKPVVRARDEVIARLRGEGRRLNHIAWFIRRDPSTVLHSLRKSVEAGQVIPKNAATHNDQSIDNKGNRIKPGDNSASLVASPFDEVNRVGCQQLEAAA